MAGVNKVILVGYLGRDPEIATTQSGSKLATLNVATSESWRDKATGERRERTEWHRVVIYNDTFVGVAERFLKKGSHVFVEGQLGTRKWTDKQGGERFTTEIVMRPYRGDLAILDRAEKAPAPDENAYGSTRTRDAAPAHADGVDDEIPF